MTDSAAKPASPARIHKGRRSVPGDPRIDTLMNMVLSLTSEVAVLRERIDAHERLVKNGEIPTPENVDAYIPDETAKEARTAQRERLLKKICRPLLGEETKD